VTFTGIETGEGGLKSQGFVLIQLLLFSGAFAELINRLKKYEDLNMHKMNLYKFDVDCGISKVHCLGPKKCQTLLILHIALGINKENA